MTDATEVRKLPPPAVPGAHDPTRVDAGIPVARGNP